MSNDVRGTLITKSVHSSGVTSYLLANFLVNIRISTNKHDEAGIFYSVVLYSSAKTRDLKIREVQARHFKPPVITCLPITCRQCALRKVTFRARQWQSLSNLRTSHCTLPIIVDLARFPRYSSNYCQTSAYFKVLFQILSNLNMLQRTLPITVNLRIFQGTLPNIAKLEHISRYSSKYCQT